MKDMETIIKNYGYIIRNPRQTKFMNRQYGKAAFLNKNKHPYKQMINDLNMDFINSKKILVTKNLKDKLDLGKMDINILKEDFLPYYSNQLLLIQGSSGLDDDSYAGYWVREKKTHYVISTFYYVKNGEKTPYKGDVIEGRGLINTTADWCLSKTENLWHSHWQESSTTHGDNMNLLHSWFKDKNMIDFYLSYTKPLQHWALKNAADNPQVKEIDFQLADEILTPIRILYFTLTLNNLTNRQECVEIDSEERLANLRNKKPLAYQYKVLDIGNVSNSTNYKYNRSVNKNKFHTVRGFERQYKSGKIVWIKNHTRGDKNLGVVEKDYIVSKFKKTDEHNDNHVED